MYDNNGDAFGFIYNDTEYYYVKNAQNDVIAIADADGTVIANYYYDAWGKPEGITGNTEIANLNPLRYRSYYYDTESALYYLNTRYYSADICRFINGDGIIGENKDILANNLFAYCSNDPINYLDASGQGKILNWVKNTYNKFVNSTSSAVKALFNTMKNTIKTGIDVMKKVFEKMPGKSYAKAASGLGSASKVLKGNAVGLAIDVGSSVVGDIIDKAPPAKILNNAMAELLCGVAGIAVGGCVTQVATVVISCILAGTTFAVNPAALAIGVGAAAVWVFDFAVEYVPIGGMSIKDRIKRDFNGE